MTLSELFRAAIKYLPEEEFLCHAINRASKAAIQENQGDKSEIRRLYKLRDQAKQIVMSQLKGHITLNSWMSAQIGDEYYRVGSYVKLKNMLDARQRWARHLAKQYKGK